MGVSKYQGVALSSHSTMLRQMHLEEVLHIMGYPNFRHNSRLAFEPSSPIIDHSQFWDCNWMDFYEGVVEVIPPNIPPPEGLRSGSMNIGWQQSCWQHAD